MTETRTADVRALIASAAAALKERRDEVNRLNVFPVPDGDTGTNMSLTMDSVLAELAKLDATPTTAELCHAVTQGSLMGARGNSGVILSQILRGLCSAIDDESVFGPPIVADALARATTVAYQAVRKPAEGTMLTVVKDAASAARSAVDAGSDLADVLEATLREAYASVRRGPELLPVLKEAGVVDAGGYGLAILADGFVSAFAGRNVSPVELATAPSDLDLEVPANDWNDTEHLYCTEFLLIGEDLDRASIESWMAGVGGSQLVVGQDGLLKVHVHTDDPAKVMAYATGLGEVAEVHINNMRRQSQARAAGLASETVVHKPVERKPFGFVAVASGEGLGAILASLGVDVVVSGGQTMNPSTSELLDAVRSIDADNVILLPDNRNIVLAAQQVPAVADRPVAVVPTTSVPQAFSAMLAFDSAASLEDNVAAMTEAASGVVTGEVTTAVKDSSGKAGPIRQGQVIGIADHEIEVVGEDVADVAARLLDVIADGHETLTVLGGADLSDEALGSLADALAAAHPELEVEAHRGDQPLYPVLLAVE